MTTTHTEIPQCWADFHKLIDAGTKRLVLLGLPGIGKTYGALTYGPNGTKVNSYRISCFEGMTEMDILGGMLPNKDGGFTWHDGQGLKAWKQGLRLVIDEIDRANGDVLSLLLALTDSEESAVIEHPDTGERLTPHPDFTAIITSNAKSKKLLHPALADRFPASLVIDEPHPEALAKLPADVRIIAKEFVSMTDSGRASLRAFQEFARLRDIIGKADAMRLIFTESQVTAIDEAMAIAGAGESE